MKSRQEKIGLLARINRGKKAMPVFLASLSLALECPIKSDSIQSLTETDSLWQLYGQGYSSAITGVQASYRRMFSRNEATRVFRVAECLASFLPDEKAFLLDKQSEICGAVEVGVANLLQHTKQTIKLDGDAVRVVSQDKTQGFVIDFNPDDADWNYEIAVWGDRWPLLILGCDYE